MYQDNAILAPNNIAILKNFTEKNFMHASVLLIEITMLYAVVGQINVIMEKMLMEDLLVVEHVLTGIMIVLTAIRKIAIRMII
nr:unnamed protein product [Meloidogyne enterolobii]